MGLHPYCVVPRERSPGPGLRGLEGGRVWSVPVEGVAVWVSDLETAPDPSVPALRAHDAVIGAAFPVEGPGPLPVRFGSWVESRRTLERRMRDRHEAYRTALERLGDAREYGLRILESEEASESTTSSGPARTGAEYMERLARRYAERDRRERRADEVLRALREAVGGTAADERVERPTGSSSLLSVAHLVPRETTDAYRDRIDRFRSEHAGLRAVSTGPWAAYSFAP